MRSSSVLSKDIQMNGARPFTGDRLSFSTLSQRTIFDSKLANKSVFAGDLTGKASLPCQQFAVLGWEFQGFPQSISDVVHSAHILPARDHISPAALSNAPARSRAEV